MKKKHGKVLLLACVLVLLAMAVTGLLPIALAEQDQIGNAEISAGVKNIEINWTSGKVHIAYHSGSTIKISEKADGGLSEDRRMRWLLDGNTLRIQYEKPGLQVFSFFSPKKELTVELPEDFSLKEARFTTASADVIIPALRADSIELATASGDIQAKVSGRKIKADTVSGDLELQVMNEAEDIEIGSVSGDIILETAGARDKIKLESVSGKIRAAVKQTSQFKAGSVSGDIHAVIGEARKAEIESTSGRLIVEIARMDALDVHTISGAVTAFLPASPGFTARITTTSGRIENYLPMTRRGTEDVCGDGSGEVKIRTTSGSITINAKEN